MPMSEFNYETILYFIDGEINTVRDFWHSSGVSEVDIIALKLLFYFSSNLNMDSLLMFNILKELV